MNRLIPITILSLCLCGCISEYGAPSAGVPSVPLADLLNNPAKWNKQKIRVDGFFIYELEGDAIYLTRADLEKKNSNKAVFLGLDDPALRIPYATDGIANKWRQFIVTMSLNRHRGKTASVTGFFEVMPYGGLNLGHIKVSQMTLK
ncbi:hypothetical protein F6V25_08145 [Oryzomonas japonica]|uniref:Uncharacterized protein n=1 Tax=Oryzomonas japonica TaxID=2603858 RepID=A0A7J4ZR71_9BACT|nr:hypothetical protein [Oryzomonas japonica]KAB0665682.1 hypothetical protein F6V25_08145 [Oryzomonas japonica]